MGGPLIATVQGRVQLVVGDGEPVDLGAVTIPIVAETSTDRGEMVLRATPNMGEVRDVINQIFNRESS